MGTERKSPPLPPPLPPKKGPDGRSNTSTSIILREVMMGQPVISLPHRVEREHVEKSLKEARERFDKEAALSVVLNSTEHISNAAQEALEAAFEEFREAHGKTILIASTDVSMIKIVRSLAFNANILDVEEFPTQQAASKRSAELRIAEEKRRKAATTSST